MSLAATRAATPLAPPPPLPSPQCINEVELTLVKSLSKGGTLSKAMSKKVRWGASQLPGSASCFQSGCTHAT